ncbi:MAG: hypothetical protein M3Q10_16505 [Chloroflexota bacterium]|nr:hypothetical protein [Chloroflexota bacterium]
MSRYNDEWVPTDVKDVPEVARLAEKVRDEDKPLLLERDGEALAVVVPVEWAKRFGLRAPRTEADFAAFLASAGSWKGLIDADKFLEDVYASRGRSAAPKREE